MTQLAFDISLPPNYQEEEYLVAKCNRDAWATLQQWDTAQEHCMLLRGPAASGKTHLAHIWAQRNNARILPAASLTKHSAFSEQLFILQQTHCLVLEDVDAIGDETTLFHLLNFMRETDDYRLLITGRSEAHWGSFILPDLRSRLQALPQAEIQQPDDALLMALLVKNFQDKQVDISQSSLGFLLPRIERSFAGVKQTIEALDQHAIAKKRPITRHLIQEVLTQASLSVNNAKL
mgnify:CR=1 FL=1